MTRFRHDQFAKDYLKELLAPLGEVQAPRSVPGEVREIDVWFAPSPQPALEPQTLGILGRLAASPCLLEPFRNPPTPTEIRSCLLKLFELHGEFQRQARRDEQRLQEADLPRLWILSPTASGPLLDGFRAIVDEENWMRGIYFLADYLRAAVVVIHQLPRTPETLWLRILGKGTVQKQAISELASLRVNHPLRANALLLLTNLQASLQTSEDLDEEEQELIMELSPLVVQWREEALREGEMRGIQQERRQVVENLLRFRFGSLDEQLLAIIEPLLELPPEEFTRLLLQLSREELLTRFGSPNL
ncbi:MAG: hypothetical protein JO235_14255 [Chroococcidiopsidaceae cyanobacterium CP_BM_RX_35]|nr:hypothetical protein [Chroococcidiopsidaceae cyanobacterium CP_BM_RX_35]